MGFGVSFRCSLLVFVFSQAFVGWAQSAPNVFEDELKNYAFQETNTDALIVQKNGRVIFEAYSKNSNRQRPHLLWSATKSITNMLVGIAVQEKKIELGESVCVKLVELKGSEYCRITVSDLLNWGSGLKWNEVYENSITESSPISMLYGSGRNEMSKFISADPHNLDVAPGTRWMYSSGDTNLLTKILQRSYNKREYDRLPWSKWASKLGIHSLTLEQDTSGSYVGSSYAYMTARDALKWGRELLNPKKLNLPKWWMPFSLQVSDAFLKDRVLLDAQDLPAKQWWINKSVPGLARKAFKYAPEDLFAAHGHWGQLIAVIPSEKIIVVRFGNDRKSGVLNYDELLRRARQFALNTEVPVTDEIAGNPELLSPFHSDLDYGGANPQGQTINLLGAYRAKEFCSCYFVMKKDKTYCESYTENPPLPNELVPVTVDEATKEVSVLSFKAKFKNRRHGCVFVN